MWCNLALEEGDADEETKYDRHFDSFYSCLKDGETGRPARISKCGIGLGRVTDPNTEIPDGNESSETETESASTPEPGTDMADVLHRTGRTKAAGVVGTLLGLGFVVGLC